ncbi:break repair meiotic recombinase recruitment factor 1 [Grus americana]|uniref:break repair meiotic recombinase recruitment factor 1 n=1 Tax=Grus americana TaxID=9117 RepID=UPI0024082279|nr:break repair meiotic recombinase recruitment factor 1 [Grus americana]
MGKRKNEQPPGDGKRHIPKIKQSPWEDSEVMGDDGLNATGPAQTGDPDGKPKSQGQATHGSTGSTAADAPRRSDASILLFQERGDTGIGESGKLPEAASKPDSPQQANSAAAEDQPVATTEWCGSAAEDLNTKTPTHCGTGNVGSERSCVAPARGEGEAGRETVLPTDTAGTSTGSSVPAEVPDPHCEEGVNRSEPGERRGDANQIQEPPPASVVHTEENESGTVSERVAGGEHRENVSEEQPQATGTNDTVKNAAESWCSPAGGGVSAEVSGVCAPSADLKVEGGTAELESAGTAGTISPVSGNTSPRKSSALEPAVPAVGNPAGERESDGHAEARRGAEHVVGAPRKDTPPSARSGDLPRGGGTAESVPAVTVTPAPPGTASPPAAGAALAVGADLQDEPGSAGVPPSPQSEPRGVPEGNSPELPPQQRLPAVPGHELCAAVGRSRAEEALPLTEGNGPAQPPPRDEEPEELRPSAHGEDATDVVCGLILELSNLNRLAMSAHRGLEALRRPKPRRSRRPGTVPVHAGRRWKET